MTARIYLLVGDTGEYSDHTQWNVAAYTTREQAEAHQQALLAATKLEGEAWQLSDERKDKVRAELDPQYIGYGETAYTVVELRLFRHLDEFLENPGGS